MELYQKLLDRGWRRSGKVLYKPDLRASCCPQYTIRLDSSAFRPSKDQRQTLNRFNNFIIGQTYRTAAARLYPKTREQAQRRKQEFDLLERIHESEQGFLNIPPELAHSFKVTLETDDFTEEKFKLYENYQSVVHHDLKSEISRINFNLFLCNSPLRPRTVSKTETQDLLGSYHQCYRIDGKLVAMGVLDLLPHAVSAVYFMYHESVNDLGFGKLGAMREIAMAKESGYRWWYAGFYIHTCKKMRYKGDYSPQYILDPESYLWYLFSKDIKNQLDTSKYLGFSKEKSEASEHLSNAISASSPCESTEQEGSTANNRISDLDEDDVPVFATGMPGILTRDELLSQVDLNEVIIEVDNMRTKASCLIGWQKSNIDSNLSVKGFIAGLVATVGPDLLSKIVIKLR